MCAFTQFCASVNDSNYGRKTHSSVFYTAAGEWSTVKISFLAGLKCGTFLQITGVPRVFLLIFIQLYFSSRAGKKIYGEIIWYVLKLCIIRPLRVLPKIIQLEFIHLKVLLPVQVYLVKLTERAKSLYKTAIRLVSIEEIKIESTLK